MARSVREDRAWVYISLDTLIAVAVFAITLAAPARGLLLVAALAPLDPADAIAAAFIAGWVLRALPDRPGPGVAAPMFGWLFCALVVGSLAGVGLEPGRVSAGARYVLGFALAVATVTLFRKHPGLSIDLPVALAAGGCMAVLTAVGGSTVDSPALAACFALVASLTIGMSARAGGRARLAWAAASVWLIAGCALAVVRSPHVASAFSRAQPLIAATLRVLASRPFFGVGIGRDEFTTSLFYSPWLSWHGGALGTHNLLVIAAELGLVGLALWIVWIGAGLLRAARALTIDHRDARLWGATVGVALYVAALAVSRPLAFSETVFPFLLQFGLMTGLAGSTLLETTPEWTRPSRWRVALTALAMAAIAAGALVSARRGPLDPPASQAADGYASFFVDEVVTGVQLPLRAPSATAESSVSVEIKIDGGEPQAAAVGSAWQIVNIVLPESSAVGRFHRIDVKMPEQGVELGEIRVDSRP